MKTELIRVFEHESLTVVEKVFTHDHLKLLSKYLGDREGDDFPYYSLINKGVRFKQYVGVICVGKLQIEVLPKADKNAGNKDVWEQHLLEMLRVVYKLKVNVPTNAPQKLKRSHVLDVFLDHFLNEVERILHIGLVKAYRRIEDNRTSLKGRLVMSKHIAKNIVHKERFYVNYTTYDRNHVFNRLLYKTLRIIPDVTSNNHIALRAKTLMFEFPELNDIAVSDSLFSKLSYDRKTEEYRDAIELAKMILLNYMPNLKYSNNNNVLALMFDMNKLWEEYVYIMLKRRIGVKYTVLSQNSKSFWRSDTMGKPKTIRPDIVVLDSEGKNCIAVLDTKWKCPKDGKPSDADLKQMFVYHEYWKTERTALLYPGNSANTDGIFYKTPSGSFTSRKCSMIYIPINEGSNKANLNEMINLIDVVSFCESS